MLMNLLPFGNIFKNGKAVLTGSFSDDFTYQATILVEAQEEVNSTYF